MPPSLPLLIHRRRRSVLGTSGKMTRRTLLHATSPLVFLRDLPGLPGNVVPDVGRPHARPTPPTRCNRPGKTLPHASGFASAPRIHPGRLVGQRATARECTSPRKSWPIIVNASAVVPSYAIACFLAARGTYEIGQLTSSRRVAVKGMTVGQGPTSNPLNGLKVRTSTV